jgi:hypothetical protein
MFTREGPRCWRRGEPREPTCGEKETTGPVPAPAYCSCLVGLWMCCSEVYLTIKAFRVNAAFCVCDRHELQCKAGCSILGRSLSICAQVESTLPFQARRGRCDYFRPKTGRPILPRIGGCTLMVIAISRVTFEISGLGESAER